MRILTFRRLAKAAALCAIGCFGVAGVSAATSPSTACSIQSMAAEYGLTIGAPSAKSLADSASIDASVASEYPASSVVDRTNASIKSDRLPTLDGRDAVLIELANVQDAAVGGPVGFEPGTIRVVCAVTIYDADTGEFLATLKDLSAK